MRPALEYLYSLQKFGMKFGLRNIQSLLRSIGSPQKKIRTIHVAGTNGKGSTSSMIAAILTAAGYKVGLYTSPHLLTFNERIRINGVMISDKKIDKYIRKLKPQIDRISATFFESATAMAFQYFADQHVDIAVIETGLGGRLDSTNVIRSMVSVITSIGKDHTQQLGNTIQLIAAEKAGIIKSNVPVVIGPLSGRAKKVIVSIARQKKSVLIDSTALKSPHGIKMQLQGKHQIGNAKSAIAAINVVSRQMIIGNAAIRQGLENTSQLSGLRARFELRKGKPEILMDVAHNPDGIKTLVQELRKLPHDHFTVIFGVMKDKNYRTILQHLKKLHPVIIATQPSTDRALPAEQLYSICKKMNLRCFLTSNVKKALTLGREKTGKGGLLVITGSHFLVGDMIPLLENKS